MPYLTHMKTILRSAAVSAALLIPTLASAATIFGGSSDSGGFFGFSWGGGGGGSYGCAGGAAICNLANLVLFVINSVLVPVLFAIAFIVFLYGVFAKYIMSHGDPAKVSEGHKLILWGLIGFAIMISVWGLVNVVANTFGLAGYAAPPLPQSPDSTYSTYPSPL
jgi:hypothetical protein